MPLLVQKRTVPALVQYVQEPLKLIRNVPNCCRKVTRAVFIAISVYFHFIYGLSGMPDDKLSNGLGAVPAHSFYKKHISWSV